MLDIYDSIEALGLTEHGAQLSMPEDYTTLKAIQVAFGALETDPSGTCLEEHIEPLLHRITTTIHQRAKHVTEATDKNICTMKGLIRCADRSEVLKTQMEDAIRSTEKLKEQQDALVTMAQGCRDAALKDHQQRVYFTFRRSYRTERSPYRSRL